MDTLGKRIFLAHKALESKLGHDVSFAELGRVIAEREKRKDGKGKVWPYSGGNVLRWERDQKRPSLEAIGALAELAGFRKGFVAFGELPQYNTTAESGEGGRGVRELPPETLEPIAPTKRDRHETRTALGKHTAASSRPARRAR